MVVCVCVCVCVCQNVHIDPPPNKDHLHHRIYPSPGKAKEPIVTANWFLSRRRHHLDNNVCRVNLLHQSQYPKWEVVDLIASSDEHTNYNKSPFKKSGKLVSLMICHKWYFYIDTGRSVALSI